MNRRTLLRGLAGSAGLALAAPAVLRAARALDAPAATLPFGRGSWEALRRRHAGQATLVHFWGLTCGPCLVELPEWGRLRASNPRLHLVLVAADPLPQPQDWIDRTLRKAGLAGVENWSFQDRFTERLYWEVDHDWQGELPFTVQLAADGSQQGETGAADFAVLRRWAGGA